jgi:hypothetical protein
LRRAIDLPSLPNCDAASILVSVPVTPEHLHDELANHNLALSRRKAVQAAAAAAAGVDPPCEDTAVEGASDQAAVRGIFGQAFRTLGNHIPYNAMHTSAEGPHGGYGSWAEGLRASRESALVHTACPLQGVVVAAAAAVGAVAVAVVGGDGLKSEGDTAAGTGLEWVKIRGRRDGDGRIAD